jgi:hypothetical protein
MTALGVCLLAFVMTYWAGKKSLSLGIVVLLAFGYSYGIVRANMPTAASHFIFDAALFGLYSSQKWGNSSKSPESGVLRVWLLLLTLWPALLIFMPTQPMLVSLVGFRGAVFFLPMAWLGSRMTGRDVYLLSVGIAGLNLAALGFAVAEYFMGIQRFYPVSTVTAIIYGSSDVAGGFYRIPATFVTAHSYGGMMVATIPFLIGTWDQARNHIIRLTVIIGAAAALLGVLLSATRLNFVLSAVLVLVAIFNGRMKTSRRAVFVLLVVGMMVVALNNSRMQRFKTLSDSDSVESRIAGSVNRGFFEILVDYPLGNGLGGGGTSIPYFLEGQVRNPVSMENEYARILSEQGVIGLFLWVGFIGWLLSRSKSILAKGQWATCRRLIWGLSVIGLFTGMLGTGMLTAIPETAIFLLGIGFIATPMPSEAPGRLPDVSPAMTPERRYRNVPSLGAQLGTD